MFPSSKNVLDKGCILAEMIEVIIKKIDKKKTVEEIADMLEQDPRYIRTIADLRKAHPEYSALEMAKELAASQIPSSKPRGI